jgi:hypothetical protein
MGDSRAARIRLDNDVIVAENDDLRYPSRTLQDKGGWPQSTER